MQNAKYFYAFLPIAETKRRQAKACLLKIANEIIR